MNLLDAFGYKSEIHIANNFNKTVIVMLVESINRKVSDINAKL